MDVAVFFSYSVDSSFFFFHLMHLAKLIGTSNSIGVDCNETRAWDNNVTALYYLVGR